MHLKPTKNFVQHMETVLWLIEHVKSSLWSFVLQISHWMVLHGPVDQLKLMAIKSRHSLRVIKLYHEGVSQHIQNIQIKHWKSFASAWLCFVLAALGLSCASLHHMGSSVVMHGLSHCGSRAQLLCGMWGLSSLTRDQTCVPCTARQILNHWTTREFPSLVMLIALMFGFP